MTDTPRMALNAATTPPTASNTTRLLGRQRRHRRHPPPLPLSFDWDGHTLLLATEADSPTGRNLAGGHARIGLGHTRDVVMIDGDVETLDLDALPAERGERASTPVP